MHDDNGENERCLRAIAHLVNHVRPDWHQQGIMAALRECPTGSIPDLTIAAMSAARDRTDQRTPAVIALDGPHWHARSAREDAVRTPQPPPVTIRPRTNAERAAQQEINRKHLATLRAQLRDRSDQ